MKNNRGFTIVELLIVIVVIAILAAITIVAYNGIQQRAQSSAAQAAVHQTQKAIELVRAQNDSYPSSINSCPTPAAGAACVQIPSGFSATYQAIPQGQRAAPTYACSTSAPSYELTIRSSTRVVYKSSAECSSANEFLQYMDMAPIIDQYGLRAYKISFDIKSANTASANTVNAYMQNGSGAKYSFGAPVPVTTTYVHQSITITPTTWVSSETASVLAFYGSYGTGNIPSVKNVEITLAD